MEYVYAAMLVHKAGKPVNEDAVTKVLQAAGLNVDATRVKALVAALEGVDIEKAIETAAAAPVAMAAAPAAGGHAAPAEDKKKDEKKNEEAAAAGLGALFG